MVTLFQVPAGLGTVLSYTFRNNNLQGLTDTDLVGVQALSIRLTLTQGETNFNFVRQAFLYVATDTSITEIGYNLDVPSNNSNTLDLLVNVTDIKNLLNRSAFDLSLKLNLRANTLQTSQIYTQIVLGLDKD